MLGAKVDQEMKVLKMVLRGCLADRRSLYCQVRSTRRMTLLAFSMVEAPATWATRRGQREADSPAYPS